MAQPALVITIGAQTYRLRPGQITGLDAKDFHAQTGQRLIDVMRRGPLDLEEVAGLVWIARRRRERGLPFEVVAAEINYDSELKVEHQAGDKAPGAADDPDEDDTDPET